MAKPLFHDHSGKQGTSKEKSQGQCKSCPTGPSVLTQIPTVPLLTLAHDLSLHSYTFTMLAASLRITGATIKVLDRNLCLSWGKFSSPRFGIDTTWLGFYRNTH